MILRQIRPDVFKNKQIFHYELASGEDNKNATKYFEILNFLANNNFGFEAGKD